MSDYRINLEIYNGPLDLLLYLIRRNEVEINDIPISTITEQFVQYVQVIKELDLEQAGDFIVMAATLMEIKSALLLPREVIEADEEGEDLGDPRLELVKQLLEYKKFKDMASDLNEMASEQSERFPRSMLDIKRLRKELKEEQELDMESIQIWDLFEAFSVIMKSTQLARRKHEVIHDETPIDVYETEILYRAQKEKPFLFSSIFENATNRGELVGLFLAMLELMRHQLVRIEQEHTFSPIYIFALTEEPAEVAVARAVSADITALPSEINRDKKEQAKLREKEAKKGK